MQTKRFIRQEFLNNIKADAQKILFESSILVLGAGGLGSPVLLYLAGAGVGNISAAGVGNIDSSGQIGAMNVYSGNGSPTATGTRGTDVAAKSFGVYMKTPPKFKKDKKRPPKCETIISFNDFFGNENK